MMGNRLKQVVFLNDVTASTVSEWYPLDYTYATETNRTILITGTVSGVSAGVIVEGRILITNLNSSNQTVTASEVITTVANVSGAVLLANVNITQPFTHLRVRKIGSAVGRTAIGVV